MENVSSDLIRGSIDTIILRCLHRGEMYGLEICNLIREASNGTYILKQPTLYSALKRLEQRKMISSFWQDSAIGGRRHYYKLTDLGMKSFKDKKENWHGTKDVIDTLVDGISKKKQGDQVDKMRDIEVNLPSSSVTGVNAIDSSQPGVSSFDNVLISSYNPFVESDEYLTLPVGIETKNEQIQTQLKIERENFEVPQLSRYVLNIEPEPKTEVMQAVPAAEKKDDIAGKPKKFDDTLEKYISPADIRVVRANIESTVSLRAAKISQYDVELLPFVKHFQTSAPLNSDKIKQIEKKEKAVVIKDINRKRENIVLINKLRLVTVLIVSALLAVAVLVLQETLKKEYNDDEKVFFMAAYLLIGGYLVAHILNYIINPRLEKSSLGFGREHYYRFCGTAALVASVICINILVGMTFVNATDYLVFCFVPCVLVFSIYLEGLVYVLLRKKEYFAVWL